MKRHISRLMKGVWAWSQVLLTALACLIAPMIGSGAIVVHSITPVAVLTLAFVVAEFAWGSYRFNRVDLQAKDVLIIVAIAITGGLLGISTKSALPMQFATPAPVIIVSSLLVLASLLGSRAFLSLIAKLPVAKGLNADRTIVVGTGHAAATLIQVIDENANFPFRVVGCVDDEKLAETVAGKRVLGPIDALPKLIKKYGIGSVIIAIPYAPATLVKKTLNLSLQASGQNGKPPAVKILPGFLELLNDGARISHIRSVKPEDLLPREPVKVDLSTVEPHVENRIILVTGAGGSVGSELCRQIIGLKPKLLLLLGHGENSLFGIDEELRLKYGFTQTRIILADVADAARISNVFSHYRPHVVFHAAAHKHVPIVEANVCEAVRNNILGTHVVALAAAAAGAAKFVLLSTDKAVNPTSVMGVTKRLSEIISQSFVNQTGTEFVTVRFGNVLESRGSVIPIFKRQIELGGPVTITHRDMQRYFMTIPEAVSLVLEAMAIGRDGQVLVLDMGKPVNILQLAETLISLSGLTPYRDINIVETGIRPGEKLFEEILTTHEGLSTTSHERLFIARQERVAYETLARGLTTLERAVRTGERDVIVDVLRNFVPSFQPGEHLMYNGTAVVEEAFASEPSANGVLTHVGIAGANGHTSSGETPKHDGKAGASASPVGALGS